MIPTSCWKTESPTPTQTIGRSPPPAPRRSAKVGCRAPLDAHGAPVLSGAPGTAALVAANLYVFAFGFSWGPVVWVLLGEMFNNRIRGAALALAASAQWVANWLVTLTFPGLSRAGLGWAYGLYAGAAAASFLFVARFVRETKGRALEDM